MQRGCYTASYFNSPSVTLPAAARTGRLTLVSDAVVSDVLINPQEASYAVNFTNRVEIGNKLVDWDWQAAKVAFGDAIAADPNYPTTHHWYAIYLNCMRRHEDAKKELSRARSLSDLSGDYIRRLGMATLQLAGIRGSD